MRTFKINRSVPFGRILPGILLFFATIGAYAHGNHWGDMKLSISGTPVTTDVAGQSYSFTPSASGPGHSALLFSISGKPAWASFDSTTGTLSGTPTSTNIGVFDNIVISASDGGSTSSLAPFAITVSAPPNSPPTISGNPATSTSVGLTYSFTPTAGDTDGDSLSFTIQNRPAWASFNPANGALSGTTTSADAGTYSNIVISVSDGLTSASLPAFSITVAQAGSGSGNVEIAWTPPTTNTDGSVLTDLAGYNIYYGTSPTALSQTVRIANAGVTDYIFSGLTSGTWYFAVTAFTSAGAESVPSDVVSKTIG